MERQRHLSRRVLVFLNQFGQGTTAEPSQGYLETLGQFRKRYIFGVGQVDSDSTFGAHDVPKMLQTAAQSRRSVVDCKVVFRFL